MNTKILLVAKYLNAIYGYDCWSKTRKVDQGDYIRFAKEILRIFQSK